MKLRILDNSIRLRLDREEVGRVNRGGTIESHTCFPDGAKLVYGLHAGDAPGAHYSHGHLTITLATGEVDAWSTDESRVSLRASLPLANGDHLALLVEKDFECLEPRAGESQANRFPNPNAKP